MLVTFIAGYYSACIQGIRRVAHVDPIVDPITVVYMAF